MLTATMFLTPMPQKYVKKQKGFFSLFKIHIFLYYMPHVYIEKSNDYEFTTLLIWRNNGVLRFLLRYSRLHNMEQHSADFNKHIFRFYL